MDIISYIEHHGDEAAATLLGQTLRTIGAWRRGYRFPRAALLADLAHRSGGAIDIAASVRRIAAMRSAANAETPADVA